MLVKSSLIGRRQNPDNRVATIVLFKFFFMITLEKLMTELKAESLNEIVAGKGNKGHGKGHGDGSHGGTGTGRGTSAGTHASRTTMSTMSGSQS